jgi:small-conductance mechanosensitive channel
MSFWDEMIFQNTIEKWLTAVALFIAVWIAMIILKKILCRRILAFSRKTTTKLDDIIARLIHRTKFFFPLATALYFASLSLTLPHTLGVLIERLAILALLVQGGLWAAEIVTFWIDRKREQKPADDSAATATLGALNFIIRIGLWTMVLLLALDNFGLQITTLLAGLGVGGVAVALAVQNILGDLFASLSIVLDKPFIIGDFIVVDDFLGRVEHIGLKTTRIRSLSGEQLIFSNSDLLKSRIRNYKRMQERRVVFSVGVAYQTPYEKLEAVPVMIREIIEGQSDIRFERAHFKGYGDFSLDFEIVYWVQIPDYNVYMDIQQAINLALFRRFGAEGIEFAYPTQTIFLAGQEGPGRSPNHGPILAHRD